MMYHLVKTLSQLESLLKLTGDNYGLDSETSGLNTRLAQIAGVSFAWDKGEAAYVPLGHLVGDNLPIGPVMELLAKNEAEGKRALCWNAKYDLNIIQRASKGLYTPKKFLDVMELVYLDNPDRKNNGLKTVTKEDHNFDMQEFEELFSEEELKLHKKTKTLDIRTKTPAHCLSYASADADWTKVGYEKYKHIEKSQDFAVKIDTKLVDIVRRMEHNGGLEINREYVDLQIKTLQRRIDALREQIYRQLGYEFTIESPKQLGIALFEKGGIPSPGMTRGKTPIHKTDAETLDRMSDQYPVIELIVSYKKVVKALSSYFEKLAVVDDYQIPVRFSFNIYSAPTFRFSAPGGNPLIDGMCGINIQAVSNGEARDIFGVDLSADDEKDNYLEGIEDEELFFKKNTGGQEEVDVDWHLRNDLRNLPWVFPHEDEERHICIRETCGGCQSNCVTRGIDITRRTQKGVQMIPSVRQAFRAPKGWTMLSFDYDRQELVIGANMSAEPKWLQALAAGVDLHVISAAGAFGMDPADLFALKETNKAEFKRKRDIGKTLNFAVFYGATGYTLARKANIPTREGERIYDDFKRAHPTLFGWINKCHIFARREGYTTTFFGRKRGLKHIYDSNDPKMKAFGDRSAVNTAIQGTAAEVTRIAMVKVDKAIETHQLRKEVKFVQQVHDELSFLVRDELLETAAPFIKNAMEFKVKSWQVQLSVGAKAGKVWGTQKDIDVQLPGSV